MNRFCADTFAIFRELLRQEKARSSRSQLARTSQNSQWSMYIPLCILGHLCAISVITLLISGCLADKNTHKTRILHEEQANRQ
jgi:hypothetical protein